VTGVSRGIGHATVTKLLDDGFEVGGTIRNSSTPPSWSSSVHLEVADATIKTETEAAIAQLVEKLGGLDVVVANAGQGRSGGVLESADDAWFDQMRNKLATVSYLVNAALPHLKQSANPRIIVVGGITGNKPEINQGVVSATRAAQINMVSNLAAELAPFKICVNAVLLGAILTDRQRDKFAKSGSNDFDSWAAEEVKRRRIPFERFGDAREVAALIGFLASESAGYITGAMIPIAGGLGTT